MQISTWKSILYFSVFFLAKNWIGFMVSFSTCFRCNLETAVYARKFGALQNYEKCGFIFMKPPFRCSQHYIGFAFWIFKKWNQHQNFGLLHRNRFRCKRFWGVLHFFWNYRLEFHLFFCNFTFLCNSITLFAGFIIFFHFFLRKNTSFWPVFEKKEVSKSIQFMNVYLGTVFLLFFIGYILMLGAYLYYDCSFRRFKARRLFELLFHSNIYKRFCNIILISSPLCKFLKSLTHSLRFP